MKYRLFILAAIALGLLSCKPNDVKKDFSSKIVGKWKLVEYNGHTIETNNRTVFTFNQDLTGTQSSVEIVNRQGKLWRRLVPLTYHVDNDVLTTQWAETSTPESWMATILNIENGQMACDASTRFVNQVPTLVGPAKYQHLNGIDYSIDIIGRWEGLEGAGAHGASDHNWEYYSDGTYTYYSWNEEEKTWEYTNDYNEYFVDGDFFVTQWDSSNVILREAHDISISYNPNGDIMRWHGLRANGARDSFLLRRITPKQADIEAVLTGKWIAVSEDGKPCLTNNKSVHTFDGAGSVYYTLAIPGQLGEDWQNQTKLSYTLLGNDLTELGYNTHGNLVTYRSRFMKVTDDNIEVNSISGDRVGTIVLKKDHSVDYDKNIIGLWEGVSMVGDTTYGPALDRRWRYKEDGTYEYLTKVGDEWVKQDGIHEYMIDGSFFASRWNKGQDGMDYEWWDLSFSEAVDTMYWYALRGNGNETFENSFVIRRIE